MIYLIEAVEAVRELRKRKERTTPGIKSFNRKHSMKSEDRDHLGGLFHAYASEIGEPFDHEVFGVSYKISLACGGTYTAHYDPLYGTIFGRFDVPPDTSGLPSGTNPHSGKWNIHTSHGDEPVVVFEKWKSQLKWLLPLKG